jgi:hypothetical protein
MYQFRRTQDSALEAIPAEIHRIYPSDQDSIHVYANAPAPEQPN